MNQCTMYIQTYMYNKWSKEIKSDNHFNSKGERAIILLGTIDKTNIAIKIFRILGAQISFSPTVTTLPQERKNLQSV